MRQILAAILIVCSGVLVLVSLPALQNQPRKYVYLCTYSFASSQGSGLGSIELTSPKTITTLADIKSVKQAIVRSNAEEGRQVDVDKVMIINLIPLPDEKK